MKRWSDVYIALFEQRILLILIGAISTSVIITDRITITDLEKKVREKEYILAPGVTDFARVTPGVISHDYVREFAKSMATNLGSFSGKDVERKYQEIEKYLSPELRIKFREKTKKDLALFTNNDVAETLSVTDCEVAETDGGFVATVTGTQTRYVGGLKVFDGPHVVTLQLTGIAPTANTPWALQIQDISRQSEDDFRKQQRNKQ